MTAVSISTDWSNVAPSSDVSDVLFDEDMLGDCEELMDITDIYNAAVVGDDDDDEVLKEVMNEIPSLLGPSESKDEGLEDGFGSFRPSTSFNNLPMMLPEPEPSSEPAAVSAAEPSNDLTNPAASAASATSSDLMIEVVSSTSLSPDLLISPQPQQMIVPAVASNNQATAAPTVAVTSPCGTKRKTITTTMTTAPSPKRRVSLATGPKQKKSSTFKGGTSHKKCIKKKNANNTPNPLTLSNRGNITAALTVATTTALVPVKTELVKQITPTWVTPPPLANTVAIKQEPIESSVSVSTSAPAIVKLLSSYEKPKAPVATAPQTTTSSAAINAAAPAAAVLSNPPTEADFKSVAQAAVNTLIMNVGSGSNATTKTSSSDKTTKGHSDSSSMSSSSSSSSSSSKTTSSSSTSSTAKRVDTSTEHVKALTGSNWVAVCGGGSIIGDSNNGSPQNNNDKMCNRARRSNLTPDERARQNRDRNREHARNTRLRKKAYVEELKATLSALVSQRDAADLEKRHASQRELEQREVRFRVLEEFLKLRGRNEANAARWGAILEEKFCLTLPVVNFRDMVHSNDSSHRNATALHEQVLTGVTEVMNDSTLCSTFLQGLGKQGNSEIITLGYNSDRNNFFMDNCVAMLDWTATTQGASEQGIELLVKGHIRAKFSPASNKLISVVMSFDTGAILSQVNLIAKVKESSEVDAAAAAAQAAANEADALLDSLQMPHFESSSIAANVNVVPPSSCGSSASSEEKGLMLSSDDDHNRDEVEDENLMF